MKKPILSIICTFAISSNLAATELTPSTKALAALELQPEAALVRTEQIPGTSAQSVGENTEAAQRTYDKLVRYRQEVVRRQAEAERAKKTLAQIAQDSPGSFSDEWFNALKAAHNSRVLAMGAEWELARELIEADSLRKIKKIHQRKA